MDVLAVAAYSSQVEGFGGPFNVAQEHVLQRYVRRHPFRMVTAPGNVGVSFAEHAIIGG